MCHQIKNNSDVDDICFTGGNWDELRVIFGETDKVLHRANMRVKRWVFSGDREEMMEIGDITIHKTC